MAHVQYQTTVPWDSDLIDVGFLGVEGSELAISANKQTAGTPTAVAGVYAPAAQVKNLASGITYTNTGTTASPVFEALSTASSPAQQTVTVNISSAELSAMNITPVTLIAAQGGSSVIVIDELLLSMSAGATPYDFAAQLAAVTVVYNGTSVSLLGASISNATLDLAAGFQQELYQPAVSLAFYANTKIIMTSTQAPSQGDGTATVTIKYRVF